MRDVGQTQLYTGSAEEYFSDLDPGFPYLAHRVRVDQFPVPWHWHRSVELFYIQEGALEYFTPKGRLLFPAGSGGMVNSNVLHRTQPTGEGPTVTLLHIFDPSLLAGSQGGRVERRYILPITARPEVELIPLFPGKARQDSLLEGVRAAFSLDPGSFGYELRLREALAAIWLGLLELVAPAAGEQKGPKDNDKLKTMMVYVHEHYGEKLSVGEIAAAGFLSERECYRLFRSCLRLTPMAYVQSCRLQAACRMLALGEEPVTQVALACGLGSPSYLGTLLRRELGCTPRQYRRNWQDIEKNRRENGGFSGTDTV